MRILCSICSFRTEKAAQSQVDQQNLSYEAAIEKVNSSNGYNFKVIVGPLKTDHKPTMLERYLAINMTNEIQCTKIENDLDTYRKIVSKLPNSVTLIAVSKGQSTDKILNFTMRAKDILVKILNKN